MSSEPKIVRRVREFVAAHRPPPGPIVVAVSGGPDSVALLRVLAVIDMRPLVVAHLNHVLRGKDSDEDEEFVGDLARRLGLPVRSCRKDVSAAGGNLEAAARGVRYEWLTEVAREVGASWVTTGHTADDQAETVLFHLLRGTGLDGLAGIAARRRLAPGVKLVRPLLTATRADVLDGLRQISQDYRVDATNADLNRSRNRVRHELLPLLAREYNPRVVETLARLASQAADLRRDEAAARVLLRRAELPPAGPVLVFDRQVLARVPRRWRRAMWRLVWRRERWPRQEMGFREWERLAALCCGGPPAHDLPGGLRAQRRGDVIQVGPIGGF